jgi:hypothetical protein
MSGRTGSNMGFGAKGSFGFAIAESAMRAFDQKSGAISCKDYGLRSLMMSLSICLRHSGQVRCPLSAPAPAGFTGINYNFDMKGQIARVGVNYRF